MMILNILIFKSLRNHRIMRRRKSSVNINLVVQSLENRMTRVSIMIIVIFVICHLPRIIPNVYEVFSRVFPESEENFSIKILKIVNILLLIVSSSVNFIIYFIIFGGGFCFGSSRNNTGKRNYKIVKTFLYYLNIFFQIQWWKWRNFQWHHFKRNFLASQKLQGFQQQVLNWTHLMIKISHPEKRLCNTKIYFFVLTFQSWWKFSCK